MRHEVWAGNIGEEPFEIEVEPIEVPEPATVPAPAVPAAPEPDLVPA